MGLVGTGGTAIVLGGGGVLGAVQVGMLRALVEVGVRPDLVVGTSIGALNGAVLAALPPEEVVDRLDALWRSPEARALFAAGAVRRLRELARSGVAAHSSGPLRRAVTAVLGDRRIEDLPVCFTCCAASIEDAAEQLQRRIGELARALDHNDAFVIFPEGGNFTERRRLAGIARLRARGLEDMARRSEAMHHVLTKTPRWTGSTTGGHGSTTGWTTPGGRPEPLARPAPWPHHPGGRLISALHRQTPHARAGYPACFPIQRAERAEQHLDSPAEPAECGLVFRNGS